jgi:transcriptional regulator with XRE-family HTH domain
MEVKNAFAKALKQIRLNKGLTQEDFSNVSSRTYVSALERAIKSPTLDKIESLANVLKIEPLTLLTLTYMIKRNDVEADDLLQIINKEIIGLNNL